MMAAWNRYIPFAIAAEHLTWTLALMHVNTVMQIVEEERSDGRGPQLAILYDELLRRQLERRCSKGDPSLVIEDLVALPDKSILAAARQRIHTILRTASKAVNASSGSGLSEAQRALANSHKEQALAAARALQQHQGERSQAGLAAGKGKGKNKNKKEPSQREAKKRGWIQGKRQEWKDARKSKKGTW